MADIPAQLARGTFSAQSLTIREWFIGQALAGLGGRGVNAQSSIELAVAIADGVLVEMQRPGVLAELIAENDRLTKGADNER